MGADFLLYAVPQCELTKERRILAEQAILGMTRGESLAVVADTEGLLEESEDEEKDTICLNFKKQLLADLEF